MELLRKRFALDLQTFAIITLVLGNLAQAFSDVLVKLIGPGFSPFQYMFLRQLLTLLVLPAAYYLWRSRHLGATEHQPAG